MNTNQYTQKTLEALQAAQQLAVEYQHNALEPEHLLHALASQEQGLIPQLLQKLNVDPGSFAAAVAEKLSALPREAMINKLAARNMEGFYVQTKEEAKELALSLIPEGSSVGWGGSMTVKATGLLDALIDGNYKELNRDAAKTPEEKDRISKECFFADYFLTSCNAITKDGIMVNIDGNGNRVAA